MRMCIWQITIKIKVKKKGLNPREIFWIISFSLPTETDAKGSIFFFNLWASLQMHETFLSIAFF